MAARPRGAIFLTDAPRPEPMKIYTNQGRIRSRRRLGLILAGLGLALGFLAFYRYLQQPEAVDTLGLLLVAVVCSLAGTYLLNRWVRPPVPEPYINKAFERSDARHLIFHHIGPVPHLLLAPQGLLIFRVKRYAGPISYDAARERWRGRLSLLRMYVQGLTAEQVGDPTKEIAEAERKVRAWLEAKVPEHAADVPVRALALFISPDADLSAASGSPVPLVRPPELKRQSRALLGDTAMHPATHEAVRRALEAEAPRDVKVT